MAVLTVGDSASSFGIRQAPGGDVRFSFNLVDEAGAPFSLPAGAVVELIIGALPAIPAVASPGRLDWDIQSTEFDSLRDGAELAIWYRYQGFDTRWFAGYYVRSTSAGSSTSGGTVVVSTDGVQLVTVALSVGIPGEPGTVALGAHVAAADPHPTYLTAAEGNAAYVAASDARLSDSRAPSGTAGGSLAGTYPNPAVAAGVITGAEIAAAIKDPAAGTAGLRTLGAGATQAASGTDVRLSDARIPTAHKTTHAAGGADALSATDVGAIPVALLDAKGDLIVASGSDVAARLPVGADGARLTPDSTQGSGWRFSATRFLEGAGFPEGVVTAPVGSRYIDTAATNGAIEWVKTTGTGSTGWSVVVGDTGWRTVAAWTSAGVFSVGALPASWKPITGLAGSIKVRRIAANVRVSWAWIAAATSPPNDRLWIAPAGFTQDPLMSTELTQVPATGPAGQPAEFFLNAYLTRGASTMVLDGRLPGGTLTYLTPDPWPATLPGT